ncbi:transglutaminase family protein [Alsobacter sp. SYSU BS001988]
MIHLTVRHTTTYTYANPVRLGEHRMMLRPRDSHDLRLVKADLSISPKATLRWMHDVFGNSIALARFDEPTTELSIESTLQIERYPGDPRRVEVTPEARVYPFIYSSEDRQDLGRLVDLHYPDPKGALAAWAKAFVTAQPMDTLELVSSINSSIRQHFGYGVRNEEGTQTPQETLELGSGTCRDFALLMIEALRSLGVAARFVSGYLYDPALDGGPHGVQGAGATHAWVEAYLPGAGWIEYDPTNGIIGSDALLRIAVTRDPSQAIPISGAFTGRSGDFTGMKVDVDVTTRR